MPPLNPDAALSTSAQFGPFVYVLVLLIVVGAAGFAAHFKWVIMPEKEANRSNTGKLTDTVVSLKDATAALQLSQADMHKAIGTIGTIGQASHGHTRKLVAAARPIAQALQKVGDASGVDIRSEMGELHGIFHNDD